MAWSLATGAAVTLSWWGVHTVLTGTVYDPPRALPIPAGVTEGQGAEGGGELLSSSTHQPPSPSSTPPPAPDGSETATRSAPSTTPSRRPSSRPPATERNPGGEGDGKSGAESGGNVKSYAVDGGRVVFDLGETSAELVSAIPASGWQMQVWKQPTWIRVTFTRDGRELSVFCVWHDSAPRVEIDDR